MNRFSHTSRRALALLSTLVAGMPVAAFAAGAPVAIVEDVNTRSAGVEMMDYLAAGRVIRLGKHGKLVLSYLGSCVHEEIAGGTVRVGATESQVDGGTVKRTKPSCDGQHLALGGSQSKAAGVMVFRAPPKRTGSSLPEAQIRLYGASPLVEVKAATTLIIDRLDQPGEHLEVPLKGGALMRGSFYDFAKAGHALKPGGLYRARDGRREVVFAVDAFAKPGRGPLVGRLLRFPN